MISTYSIIGKIFWRLIRPFSFVLAKMKFPSSLNGRNRINRVFPIRNPILLVVLLTSLLLSGCVKYDVGLNFDNSNSGELVQHIKLGERLTSFSGDSVYE